LTLSHLSVKSGQPHDVTVAKQRSYLMFNGMRQSPSQLIVEEITHNGITKVYSDDSVTSFWFFAACWVGSIVFTWKVSIPKIKNWRRNLHENA
jgi:hypothetical protein